MQTLSIYAIQIQNVVRWDVTCYHYNYCSILHNSPVSQCPDLDPPTGGNIETTGTNFWDTATYTCDSGFNLVGVATRTCQANGAWSGTPPFCSRESSKLLRYGEGAIVIRAAFRKRC